ncbi:MAG: hypothetical protein ACYT04_54125 [Nostoc sp.]
MEITFANGKLQNLCEQQDAAKKKLGANCAQKLSKVEAIARFYSPTESNA